MDRYRLHLKVQARDPVPTPNAEAGRYVNRHSAVDAYAFLQKQNYPIKQELRESYFLSERGTGWTRGGRHTFLVKSTDVFAGLGHGEVITARGFRGLASGHLEIRKAGTRGSF